MPEDNVVQIDDEPQMERKVQTKKAIKHTMGEEAASIATANCYLSLQQLFHRDPNAIALTDREKRNLIQHQSIEELRELCNVGKQQSQYKTMQECGKFHCGIVQATYDAGKAKPPAEAVGQVHMDRKDLVAPPCDQVERLNTARIDKLPLETKSLEKLWKSNPGDSALRRMPDKHEAVFDFASCRITMPRSFGDEKHRGERRLEAGQVLQVDPDLTEDSKGGIVMISTLVPRRAHLPDTNAWQWTSENTGEEGGWSLRGSRSSPDSWSPQGSRKPISLAELDARLEEQHRGAQSDERDIQMAFNHMHIMRQPPKQKEWMEWREMQIRKRKQEQEEREQDWRTRNQIDGEFVGAGEEDGEEEDSEIDMVEMLSMGMASMVNTARSGAGSSMSARSPGRRRALDLVGIPHELPWDARPPPSGEVVERLLNKCLPPEQAEARCERSRMNQASPSTLGCDGEDDIQHSRAWTLRAEDRDFQLQFFVDAYLSPTKDPATPLQHDSDDDDFWREVFDPPPPQQGLHSACLATCGC